MVIDYMCRIKIGERSTDENEMPSLATNTIGDRVLKIVTEYEEHEKRVWSVDISLTESLMLVSGNDDYKVKVWCTKQESSVINIDMKANICFVKYNPGSSNHITVFSSHKKTTVFS